MYDKYSNTSMAKLNHKIQSIYLGIHIDIHVELRKGQSKRISLRTLIPKAENGCKLYHEILHILFFSNQVA